MKNLRVGVLFEKMPDGWLGHCPAVPGAIAHGRTIRACERRLRDAIDSILLYAPTGDVEDLEKYEPVDVAAEIVEVEAPERSARDLVNQADISRIAGVSRQAVQGWTRRSDFPSPVSRWRRGALWEREDVLRWLASGRRPAGRPSVRERWTTVAASGRR